MEKILKKAKIRWLFFSLCVVVGLFTAYRLFTDFIYLTNDDMYLQAIVSGEISGQPDAHMIYSNYILGIVLSSLYWWNSRLPWYGLYLCGVCLFCHWVVLYRCFCKCSRNGMRVLTGILFCIFSFCTVFRHIAMLQYTVVAAFAGATAVFFALTIDMHAKKREMFREYCLTFVLAAFCILIREKVFFMLVPFAACGWLAKWLTEKRKDQKLGIRYSILLVGMLGLAVLLPGADWIAYRLDSESSAEWEEYLRYNKAREGIFDYNGFPDYDENESFYEGLGISRPSYEAANRYYCLLPQPEYHASAMEEIAARSVEIRREQQPPADRIKEAAKAFLRCNLAYSDRPINIVVYAVWIGLFLFGILGKRKTIFLWLGLLFAARMGTWGVILYQGRYPDRITQGLYLAELLMLCAIYIQNAPLLEKNMSGRTKAVTWKNMLAAAYLLCVCILAFYIGIPKAMAVKGENAGKLYFGSAYQQLKEYCAKEQGNLYLLDINSASNFEASVFKPADSAEGICNNLMPLGSWPVKSPLMNQTLERYGIRNIKTELLDQDRVFFVFKDSEATPSEYLTALYQNREDEKTGVMKQMETSQNVIPQEETVQIGLRQIDTLKTDAGINYKIYRLVTKKQ